MAKDIPHIHDGQPVLFDPAAAPQPAFARRIVAAMDRGFWMTYARTLRRLRARFEPQGYEPRPLRLAPARWEDSQR